MSLAEAHATPGLSVESRAAIEHMQAAINAWGGAIGEMLGVAAFAAIWAIATSLVGAIVGELPTGAQAGLGARLLSGSYFGQTIQIWSALFMAALLGVALVAAVGLAERVTMRLMGART